MFSCSLQVYNLNVSIFNKSINFEKCCVIINSVLCKLRIYNYYFTLFYFIKIAVKGFISKIIIKYKKFYDGFKILYDN